MNTVAVETASIRSAIAEIGLAVRRPEEFAVRWRDRNLRAGPTPLVFPVLLANAALGLAAYGLTMGFHAGPAAMLLAAVKAPLSAGLAWTLALPALYIINAALGSELDASTTVLAALTTVSFGALAMLASVPVNWFFELAAPDPVLRVCINAVIFGGVGFCMADVFLRTVEALEPERSRFFPFLWLGLVGALGLELMTLFGLFTR